jgi:glyoxylase-like metal-dependent hydrolase (beta-lactamase superfamily II)
VSQQTQTDRTQPQRSGNARPSATSRTAPNGDLSRGYNPAGVRHTDSAIPLHRSGPVMHDYRSEEPAPGRLAFRWIYGSNVAAKNRDPRVQVVQYNEDTFVLRQNVCIHWEAPFIYLLFGNDGALLIDTGATANDRYFPLRETVDALIERWAQARGRDTVPLTVALTSGEDIAQNQGVVQFAGRARTTIVPTKLAAMQQHYGLSGAWPSGTARIDLGGRIIDVIPAPGAHRDGVCFYDPYCDILFTGDLLFPGRINISNDGDYLNSLERLQGFAASHSIKWVLGGHIDMMFVPGKYYPRFATYKPYERVLEMAPALIDDAVTYAREIRGQEKMLICSDFVLFNGVSPDQRTKVWPEGVPNIDPPRPF